MVDTRISNSLKGIYEGYHKNGATEWRKQTAVDKAKHIVQMCNSSDHEKIIEVGAGDGAVLYELGRQGFGNAMYALEVADTAVQTIKNREIVNLKECLVFDGYTIPYKNREFDIAIASHVLEHVEHPRLFLSELQRISKRQFIEVPLEYSWQGRRDMDGSGNYGHINYYSPLLIERLVNSSGLKIVEKKVVDFSAGFYRYQDGYRGIIKYMLRKMLLSFAPAIATTVLIYCCCLLCERQIPDVKHQKGGAV
jgi:hypothetical protein